MKKIAFIKYGGLVSGGTEINFQTIAKHLSNKYKVDYFYCDATPYLGSDYEHADTDKYRKTFLEDSKVNLIKFQIEFKDVRVPSHPWVNTNFWNLFDEKKYDLIFSTGSGHPEYPFTEIHNTQIVNYVTLNAGVNNQKNIVKTICPTKFTANEWKRQGGDETRLEVIPVCREETENIELNLRDELKLNSKFIYGFHQRDDDKIFSNIPLKAFKKIESPSNYFLLLGGSNLYNQQAEKLGINNFLRLPHTGSSKYIKKFLNTLNVFTHGRKHGETFGLVIAEAMEHSLPIISHKAESNGHIELIGNGGRVVGAKNTILYSMEMKKLEKNKNYLLQKSKYSKERYETKYSTESILKKYEKLTSEIIGV